MALHRLGKAPESPNNGSPKAGTTSCRAGESQTLSAWLSWTSRGTKR